MKSAYFVLITLLAAGISHLSTAQYLSGPLSGTLGPGTYDVVGEIYVQNGASLIIRPGTNLAFNGDYTFTIYGYLNASGTEDDSIKFYPLWGSWGGIDFDSLSVDSSKLEYCIITGSNSGGIECEYSDITISHCDIRNNSMNPNFSGGGIRVVNSNPTISNCTIVGNYAYSDAGGIQLNASDAIITNCVIDSNTAEYNGGGINCYYSSNPVIENCTINNNIAWVYWGEGGGGIHVDSSNLILTNSSISYNYTLGDGGGIALCYSNTTMTACTVYSNQGDQEGGGIYTYNSPAPSEFTNCQITGNCALYSNGGGIHFESSEPVTLTNCVIRENWANNQHGGGLYFYDTDAFLSDCIINRNNANWGHYGGGIYADTSTVSFVDCHIDSNKADVSGGGLFVQRSNFSFTNCTISYDTAYTNGGGGFFGSSNVSFVDCDINYNKLFNGNAGGIWGDGSVLNFINCQVIGNYCGENGGGIRYIVSSGSIYNCNIVNNTGVHGGGIQVENAEVEISNSLICGNNATYEGGISWYCSTINIDSCNISNNSVSINGGGLCGEGSYINITNSQIDSNSAWNGGGIFSGGYNDTLVLNGCSINHNIATSGSAGGIWAGGFSININDCEINYNSANLDNGYGGGLYCENIDSAFVSNSQINNNSANWGGGVSLFNSFAEIIYSTINGNNSSDVAGAISFNNHFAILKNCDIVNNTANSGSIINIEESDPIIMNTIIAYNTGYWSGILFDDSPNTYISFCDFYGNNNGNFYLFSGSMPNWLGIIQAVNPNGDSCDIFHNIYQDPLFVNLNAGNFNLQANSPCIDAGAPLSPPDPDGTIADIGAFYYNQNRLAGSLYGTLDAYNYLVEGDIYVEENDALIISPGANFLFQGPYSFTISGYLSAQGTESDSIKFLPDEGVELWGGLIFDSTALDNSNLEYCLVSGCDTAGISIRGSSPTIAHSVISGNSGAIGGGLQIENGAHPLIDHCLISGNDGAMGGGIFLYDADPILRNCTIAGNSSGSMFGGGISCISSSPEIVNNIITGCPSGYGIYSDTPNNNLTITYCDFYANVQANFCNVDTNLGLITASNANGDPCDIYHNIFLNPQFEDAGYGNYHLQETSPCIDAGASTSPLDPDNTIADIGAFYFNQTGVEDSEFIIHHSSFIISAFPNPFNSSVVISFELRASSPVELTIYDITGREVWKLASRIWHLGTNQVEWNAEGMPSGIYFARLTAGDYIQTQKLLLLK